MRHPRYNVFAALIVKYFQCNVQLNGKCGSGEIIPLVFFNNGCIWLLSYGSTTAAVLFRLHPADVAQPRVPVIVDLIYSFALVIEICEIQFASVVGITTIRCIFHARVRYVESIVFYFLKYDGEGRDVFTLFT